MDTAKPSKSEKKRRQLALQQLGEALIPLGDDLLDELPLDGRLREAIDDVRKMKSREAIRRQKQYIGRLMRDVDPEPITALLDRLRADDRREKRVFANAERWRDRLLSDGIDAVGDFAAETGADAEALRALLDDLSRSVSDREERTLSRRLFRLVHAALVASSQDR